MAIAEPEAYISEAARGVAQDRAFRRVGFPGVAPPATVLEVEPAWMVLERAARGAAELILRLRPGEAVTFEMPVEREGGVFDPVVWVRLSSGLEPWTARTWPG